MIRVIFRLLAAQFLRFATPLIVNGAFGGFWEFRQKKYQSIQTDGFWRKIYFYYQERYGCFIGERAQIATCPTFPHDMNGIFISNMSIIGEKVVIFQQVTIGSNTILGHPRCGSPTIGNNVYIGAGAKIIGRVTIGDNCRIGANCVVVKDMPANTTAVAASTRFIESEQALNNRFYSDVEYLEMQ